MWTINKKKNFAEFEKEVLFNIVVKNKNILLLWNKRIKNFQLFNEKQKQYRRHFYQNVIRSENKIKYFSFLAQWWTNWQEVVNHRPKEQNNTYMHTFCNRLVLIYLQTHRQMTPAIICLTVNLLTNYRWEGVHTK